MNYKSFIGESWAEFTSKCRALFPFLKKTFAGTRAEWNTLSTAEKTAYDICNLTDDVAGGDLIVSDEVTEGDLNPVTSNAVAEKFRVISLSGLTLTNNAINLAIGTDVPSWVANAQILYATTTNAAFKCFCSINAAKTIVQLAIVSDDVITTSVNANILAVL